MDIEPAACLGGNTWIMPGPTNIGIIVDKSRAWVIDSGNDKDSGRKILKFLKAGGLTLEAVVNTHSNADHIGGNAYLQSQTDCGIWTSSGESAFITFPAAEAGLLWGGFPPAELGSKFFLAKPSRVTRILQGGEKTDQFECIPLPGHFMDMMGILTRDSVFFIGDAAFGAPVLEKHKIPFVYDLKAFRESLDRILATDARVFVPSHGEPCDDPRDLVEFNRRRIDDIEAFLLTRLSQPCGFEDLLKALCDAYGQTLDMGGYALAGSTLRSFLTGMRNSGLAACSFEDNRLVWHLPRNADTKLPL